jgi:hypothetical protein
MIQPLERSGGIMTHTVSDVRVLSATHLIWCLYCSIKHIGVVATAGPTAWEVLYAFNFAVFATISAFMLWHLRGKKGSDTPPASPRVGVVLLVSVLAVTFFVGLWVDGFNWLSIAIIAALVLVFLRLRQLGRVEQRSAVVAIPLSGRRQGAKFMRLANSSRDDGGDGLRSRCGAHAMARSA